MQKGVIYWCHLKENNTFHQKVVVYALVTQSTFCHDHKITIDSFTYETNIYRASAMTLDFEDILLKKNIPNTVFVKLTF
jgi:hypothetical protein